MHCLVVYVRRARVSNNAYNLMPNLLGLVGTSWGVRDTRNCLVGHARSGMMSTCWAYAGVVPVPDHLFIVVQEKHFLSLWFRV